MFVAVLAHIRLPLRLAIASVGGPDRGSILIPQSYLPSAGTDEERRAEALWSGIAEKSPDPLVILRPVKPVRASGCWPAITPERSRAMQRLVRPPLVTPCDSKHSHGPATATSSSGNRAAFARAGSTRIACVGVANGSERNLHT